MNTKIKRYFAMRKNAADLKTIGGPGRGISAAIMASKAERDRVNIMMNNRMKKMLKKNKVSRD